MTDGEIVRRLAEFEGWRDLQLKPNYTAMWRGRRNDMHPVSDAPDYLNDVAAALRVCERVCRERKLSLAIEFAQLMPAFDGDSFHVIFGEYLPAGREWHKCDKSLARAAALAACEAINAKT